MELNYRILDELSKEYGDSFYLLDSEIFNKNYKDLLNAFTDIYPDTRIAYSYKTNYTPKLCRMVNALGGAAEVVSEMEMWLAQHIGVKGNDIYYNGPYKKAQFIEELLLLGGHINLDGRYEIDILEKIVREYPDKCFEVGVRCRIDIGQEVPSRFGFDVASGELKNAVNRMNSIDNVRVNGVHCHVPYRTLDSYVERMKALNEILDGFPGYEWDYISLGGGYMGKVDKEIARQLSYAPPSFDDYASVIAEGMRVRFAQSSHKPVLILEPGSALVANAVKYVTRVINIKTARNTQIASLTGSSFQVNPSVKDIRRPITVYHNPQTAVFTAYDHLDMAGYTCIESDYLYKDYCGTLEAGDFVVFDNVGSYSVVMKPPFILPDIAMLELLPDGRVEVIKHEQAPKDIFLYFS